MAEAVQLQGSSLMAGPTVANDGSTFPSGSTIIPLDFTPAQKTYQVTSGRQLIQINSPSTFATLPGIGAGGSVTQVSTLYLRTNSPFIFRATYQNGAPQQLQYVYGLWIAEFDPSKPLVLLEVQGAGQVEYLAVGNQ